MLKKPSVGDYTVLFILTEIGDIGRFLSTEKLPSYAGLVPRISQRSRVGRCGAITRQGRSSYVGPCRRQCEYSSL
jgi:transposase